SVRGGTPTVSLHDALPISGPFVLQGAEEVDDLPHCTGHVFWRRRFDLPRYPIESFVKQGAQRPAGAIAAEHIQVMDMDIAFAVGLTDRRRVYMAEPVIGDDLAGTIEDQSTQ